MASSCDDADPGGGSLQTRSTGSAADGLGHDGQQQQDSEGGGELPEAAESCLDGLDGDHRSGPPQPQNELGRAGNGNGLGEREAKGGEEERTRMRRRNSVMPGMQSQHSSLDKLGPRVRQARRGGEETAATTREWMRRWSRCILAWGHCASVTNVEEVDGPRSRCRSVYIGRSKVEFDVRLTSVRGIDGVPSHLGLAGRCDWLAVPGGACGAARPRRRPLELELNLEAARAPRPRERTTNTPQTDPTLQQQTTIVSFALPAAAAAARPQRDTRTSLHSCASPRAPCGLTTISR
ncbi:hypothetical protein PCL_02461 [Purpureocillium lilacinum]|uniref:Uncharacterized protein n=1 Tax=Purpureocillium lilacinum TaxID=33203 RepID=A0A2U3E0L8_PURLI|nr:hypothetical protein PCL_02461 [Purpureocillium lilacinum]